MISGYLENPNAAAPLIANHLARIEQFKNATPFIQRKPGIEIGPVQPILYKQVTWMQENGRRKTQLRVVTKLIFAVFSRIANPPPSPPALQRGTVLMRSEVSVLVWIYKDPSSDDPISATKIQRERSNKGSKSPPLINEGGHNSSGVSPDSSTSKPHSSR